MYVKKRNVYIYIIDIIRIYVEMIWKRNGGPEIVERACIRYTCQYGTYLYMCVSMMT